jgi:hypothetical protein
MVQTGRERGTSGGGPRRGRVGSRHALVAVAALAAFALLASACSSSDSVDASALPNPDAPTVGTNLDAAVNAQTNLPTFDDGNGHGGVPVNGDYQIGVRAMQSVATAVLPTRFPPDQVVTATFDTSRSPSDVSVGVVCRMQDDDNYYRLGVGNDGEYAIQRVKGGTNTVLTGNGKWAPSPLIRRSPGLFTVRAVCAGKTLTLFESNHQIATVQDREVTGPKAGVFLETFFKPNAAVQVNSLSVRAFDTGHRLTGATGDQWDALVGAQHIAARCDLLDPKHTGAGAGAAFATQCGDVVYVQASPPTTGAQLFDRLLRRAGTTLEKVQGLPDCSKRTGIEGPLSTTGRVACLDLGDSTAVVWSNEPAGVVGVIRVKHDDRAAWKGYGPSWPPFAYGQAPG